MVIKLKDVWVIAGILASAEIALWLLIGGGRPQLGVIGAFALACTGTAFLRHPKDPSPND